ncbi:hypothetical protein [Luteipulveratus halotolerans]|uniref:Uncharacterized protein n=1 Tax=Luteipulveratus halotolerans TaxID=1631356 RepID=A0A0L6CEC0_9MICO|nr:hypothetical protein [Luteipulveratus halotolerans]KNX35848.1 hypothetical protein VV01_21400 [Luteipulveratus halotolerans]
MSIAATKVSSDLRGAHGELRSAAKMIEELRDSVRSVRRLLGDATSDNSKTRIVEDPIASGYMRNVAQRMEQIAGRAGLTEAMGKD